MSYCGPERKQIRLSGYDYSSDGYYFITICTNNREEFFGEIKNGIMSLNGMGCIAAKCWQAISEYFDDVKLDEWQIMPNHLHGILVIKKPLFVGGAHGGGGVAHVGGAHGGGGVAHVGGAHVRPLQCDGKMVDRSKMLMPKIVHGFKSSVTREINAVQNKKYFQWQRSYYDHIVRNEKSLDNIRNYVRNNPLEWELDVENQKNGYSEWKIKNYYNDLFAL